METKEAIKILKEMQESCRYRTYIDNEVRNEWKKEYQAIEVILKDNTRLDKENQKLFEENLCQRKVIELACKMIKNYDSQLVINYFGDIGDIKEFLYKKVEEQEQC